MEELLKKIIEVTERLEKPVDEVIALINEAQEVGDEINSLSKEDRTALLKLANENEVINRVNDKVVGLSKILE